MELTRVASGKGTPSGDCRQQLMDAGLGPTSIKGPAPHPHPHPHPLPLPRPKPARTRKVETVNVELEAERQSNTSSDSEVSELKDADVRGVAAEMLQCGTFMLNGVFIHFPMTR